MNPRYPIYIISKGRWENRMTANSLEKMRVPYSIVIEPQEFDQYAAVIDPSKILVLPFSNLGLGSIPARNWVWDHAAATGAHRHWILDDNINGFYRLNHNLKIQVSSGTIFRAAEDFCDRYENVAMFGFDYFMFASRKTVMPAFRLNTRVYSCICLRNDINYRWRGRYNEDTDLSIRILKDGWCTILFSAFLAMKSTTGSVKGGNMSELYGGDQETKEKTEAWQNKRLEMAQSLVDQHPDIVTVTMKWGRPQHNVYYKGFKKNKLKLKPGVVVKDGIDNYGMRLIEITEEQKAFL